jgi:hypothetical protein
VKEKVYLILKEIPSKTFKKVRFEEIAEWNIRIFIGYIFLG